jgi:hypothetical protein
MSEANVEIIRRDYEREAVAFRRRRTSAPSSRSSEAKEAGAATTA